MSESAFKNSPAAMAGLVAALYECRCPCSARSLPRLVSCVSRSCVSAWGGPLQRHRFQQEPWPNLPRCRPHHAPTLFRSAITNPQSEILLIPAPPKQSARDMRPLWRDLILQTRGGDPLQCPCCKGTMKPVRKVIRREEIEKRRRLVGVLDRNPRSG